MAFILPHLNLNDDPHFVRAESAALLRLRYESAATPALVSEVLGSTGLALHQACSLWPQQACCSLPWGMGDSVAVIFPTQVQGSNRQELQPSGLGEEDSMVGF
jgi:hypothetical protein